MSEQVLPPTSPVPKRTRLIVSRTMNSWLFWLALGCLCMVETWRWAGRCDLPAEGFWILGLLSHLRAAVLIISALGSGKKGEVQPGRDDLSRDLSHTAPRLSSDTDLSKPGGYTRALNHPITASDGAGFARVSALAARMDGRLLVVCATCIQRGTRDALEGMDNITWGMCAGCVDAQ